MPLSRRQIERVWIAEGGNPRYAKAMSRIALRESGGHAHINNARSGPGGTRLNSNGTVDWGLYGVNDVWRKDPVVGRLFKTGEILTPRGATKAAIHILQTQGPQAWRTGNASVDSHYLSGLGRRARVSAPRAAPRPSPTPNAGVNLSSLLQGLRSPVDDSAILARAPNTYDPLHLKS